MFENFSFSAPSRDRVPSNDSPPLSFPSTTNSPTILDDTIEMVSPFSSRCPSPFQKDVPPQTAPRTYPTSQPRHLSITSLTSKLRAHTLYTDNSENLPSSEFYAYNSSDEEAEIDVDEGYSEGDSDTLSTPPLSAVESPASYLDVDIPSLPPTPTSVPSQSTNQLFSIIRRNRAALTRLQCSANNATHLAMLVEEQHPSALPFSTLHSPTSYVGEGVSPERRRASVASIGKRKVQKSRSRKNSVTSFKALDCTSPMPNGSAVVKRGARMRKGTGGSPSGAGRR